VGFETNYNTYMNKTLKTILEVILFLGIIGLVFAIYSSIMKPVNFDKQTEQRSKVAIQRLKDIRTLQVAFKSINGKFTADVDSLKDFYENGKMKIIMQVGSEDDSLAVAHTAAVKKASKSKLSGTDLYAMYLAGDTKLVFSVENEIAVKDTLFNGREDFAIDSLKTIPFSGGEPIQMDAEVRMVSGVQVPLFEARIPYKLLLKGMDNQLRINLDAKMRKMNRYEGLQVGSITAPNNNAGNWE